MKIPKQKTGTNNGYCSETLDHLEETTEFQFQKEIRYC